MITRGRREEAESHLREAVALLADRPPSRSKVRVLASRAHLHLAADEAEEATSAAGEALRMADELRLDDFRAHTLSTRGFSRVMTGDLDGLDDLRESVQVAALANSPQVARGFNLLASMTADLGDLTRAFELYAESRRAAERFGDALALRWLEVERVFEAYWRGNWTHALEIGAGLLAQGAEGNGSLHEVDVLLVRAKVQLAREGPQPALESVERALAAARSVGAPQLLFPVLAFDAHALAASGRGDAASDAADELLGLWLDEGRGHSLGSFWIPDLAFALLELNRADDLVDAARRAPTTTRWLEAAQAAAEGDWRRAADTFSHIGSLPDEALARLRAAADLAADGREHDAERERRRANSFYRDVGAVSYVGVSD
jgi:hypothetical protein